MSQKLRGGIRLSLLPIVHQFFGSTLTPARGAGILSNTVTDSVLMGMSAYKQKMHTNSFAIAAYSIAAAAAAAMRVFRWWANRAHAEDTDTAWQERSRPSAPWTTPRRFWLALDSGLRRNDGLAGVLDW